MTNHSSTLFHFRCRNRVAFLINVVVVFLQMAMFHRLGWRLTVPPSDIRRYNDSGNKYTVACAIEIWIQMGLAVVLLGILVASLVEVRLDGIHHSRTHNPIYHQHTKRQFSNSCHSRPFLIRFHEARFYEASHRREVEKVQRGMPRGVTVALSFRSQCRVQYAALGRAHHCSLQ